MNIDTLTNEQKRLTREIESCKATVIDMQTRITMAEGQLAVVDKLIKDNQPAAPTAAK